MFRFVCQVQALFSKNLHPHKTQVVFKALLFVKTCLYTLRNTFAGRCKRRKQTVATANGIKKSSEQEEQKKGSTPELGTRINFKTMKTFTESMLNQCRKYMFNFFDYLPTKYKASSRDWQVRNFVWAFKDGKCAVSAAQLVAKKSVSSTVTERVTSCLLVFLPVANGK